ncbi:hypothetical protein BJX96DRAFT_138569 [Aspergillus floccosus]
MNKLLTHSLIYTGDSTRFAIDPEAVQTTPKHSNCLTHRRRTRNREQQKSAREADWNRSPKCSLIVPTSTTGTGKSRRGYRMRYAIYGPAFRSSLSPWSRPPRVASDNAIARIYRVAQARSVWLAPYWLWSPRPRIERFGLPNPRASLFNENPISPRGHLTQTEQRRHRVTLLLYSRNRDAALWEFVEAGIRARSGED